MAKVRANGIEIEYDERGDPGGEAVLLIMGLGSQLTRWPEPFCDLLAARGLRVIRFDNRDVGLSSKFDDAGRVDIGAVLQAVARGEQISLPYTLEDMAADAVGLLDALGVARAHIVGASLGGMIAQLVAADYPERVLSLTSIMSTTGNRALSLTTPEAAAVLMNRGPDPRQDLEGYLAHAVRGRQTIGSPAYPTDPVVLRERALAEYKRSFSPAGFARQYAAALTAPDRRAKLRTIATPTMVLHGEADPLIMPAGGRDTHENIPGSILRIVPGMGHDVPEPLYGEIVDAIMIVVEQARAKERRAR